MSLSAKNRWHQQGFTLTEVIVAIAIFVVVFVAALMLYDRANRVFATGSQQSDLQQNTRVAFEKMVSDLRMAGFDYDRDGIPFSSAAGVRAWQANHLYGPGSAVVPTTSNGFTYVSGDQATSGGFEPTWNTTVGGTTNDGGITWSTQAGVNQFEQPDEQIEYAGASAITIRGNFDYETRKNCDNGREAGLRPDGTTACTDKPDLESAQFPVVTTGNDEIVTYALKPDSGTGPNRIQFYADVPDRRAYPGGRSENLVSIPGVDLCISGCNAPPYTLYRITLDTDGTIISSPLATNVRSIAFQYYNNTTGTGTPLSFTPSLTATTGPFNAGTPGSSGGGQFNPLSPAASQAIRAYRSSIQSVRVVLTGMNQTLEPGYQNPAETSTSPAKSYRTYSLESLIVPRNLGKIGQRAVQEAPPGPPSIQTVCVGWCGIAKVDWIAPLANPANGTVEQYVIIYDTANPPVRFQQYISGGTTSGYVYGLTPGTQYFFSVAAVNSFGNNRDTHVLPASAPGLDPLNRLRPDVPTNIVASGSGVSGEPPVAANEIDLSWSSPQANLSGANLASCVSVGGGSTTQTATIPPGEIDKYEVYRSTDPSTLGVNVADLAQYPHNVMTINQASVTFSDKSAVPCVQYYYRLRGLKSACYPATGANNASPGRPFTDTVPVAASSGHPGIATAAAPPDAPATLLVRTPPLPNPVSSCGVTCSIYLSWPKVVQDNETPAKPMTVQDYILSRQRFVGGVIDTAPDALSTRTISDTTPGNGIDVTFSPGNTGYYLDPDSLPSVDGSGNVYQYEYTVKATLACATPPPAPATSWDSNPSPPVRYPCPFAVGSFDAQMTNYVTGDGLSFATAWESDGTGSSALRVTGTGMASVQVLLRDFGNSAVVDMGTQTSGFTWPIIPGVHTEQGEYYQIFMISKDTNNCQDIKVRYYLEGTASGCCLAAQANDPFVIQFTPGSSFVDVFLKNECGNPLNVQTNGVRVNWDPATLPASSRLRSIDFPATAGGTVNTGNLNDATGSVITSVPSGGVTTIAASSTSYSIRINFNIPGGVGITTLPLTNVCVTYLRPGIDAANQNCRILPRPASFNSCN